MISNFYIEPLEGAFDVESIRAWLDACPDVFEHPHRANRFYLNGYPSRADSARVDLESSIEPSASIVIVDSASVFIGNEFGHSFDARRAVEFFEWLWSSRACRLRHEYGHDITAEFQANGVAFLFDQLADEPKAWTESLIPLGRFRELDRYDSFSGPSLEIAKRAVPSESESSIVKYLQSGSVLRRVGVEVFDVYDAEHSLGQLDLLTDGLYVWPTDLVYYVLRYHVRLPRAFIIHARKNSWAVPADIDVASLPPVPP